MTEVISVECIGGPRDGEIIRVTERVPDGDKMHIRRYSTSHDCCIYVLNKEFRKTVYLQDCSVCYIVHIPGEVWKEHYGKDND